jgi:ribosome recycling factor
MANEFIQKYSEEFNKNIEHFKKEMASMKAGRANPIMVENVPVLAYGVKTPIKQLGSISVPEPRTINIEPWDKSLLKEIEKAITYANLGLGVTAEAALVRVTVPQMTEESRKELIKTINSKLEEAKIATRSIREKVKEEILSAQKNGDITEDDRYAYAEELDKKVSEINKQLESMVQVKEKEIMTV